jgi:NADPH-dependent glutamate synthase beta subunit-like oxidoreductase
LESDIAAWVHELREERYQNAWRLITALNPFPGVTGRLCHHPCEQSCNRLQFDGAVTVNALEQFCGDLALREGWSLGRPEGGKGVRVAVVGGGPAGLSCAYQLHLAGYTVTVYEAKGKPGGVLQAGIPAYRLPERSFGEELERLLDQGIKVETNAAVRGADLATLLKEHAAVCLAMGAGRVNAPPQFPAGDPRIVTALDFLAGESDLGQIGEEAVVIGGGRVAIDAARTARRFGKRVKVLAMERVEVLPAGAEEVGEGLAEGVLIYGGVMVREVERRPEGLRLRCSGAVLDGQPPVGVYRPVPIPESDFTIDTGTVILATGQEPDVSDLAEICEIRDSLVVVDGRQATSRPGIFACGDVTTTGTGRFVAAALGGGIRAALGIVNYLEKRNDGEPEQTAPVSFAAINTFYFPLVPAFVKGSMDPDERVTDFREVKVNLFSQDALVQAGRCFNCGHCLKCDNCYYFCPDMAVVMEEGNYKTDEKHCKGCGLCVEECPRGAVFLKEEIT